MAICTPLHAAARHGDLAAARKILADDPLAAISMDDFQRIPLHLAASSATPDAMMLECVGSEKCCLTMRNRAGLPPLVCARSALAVNTLVRLGADINASGDNGETLLHLAAASEEAPPELLAAAIAAGAALDARDANGKLPLHVAAAAGRVDAACTLLDHAAADDRQQPRKQPSAQWASAQQASMQASARCGRGLTAAQYALLAWSHGWLDGDNARDEAFSGLLRR